LDIYKDRNGKELILFARSISPSLGTKERKVATFIAENFKQVSEISIKDLSSILSVSEATIIKVCKKLECGGFYKLKKELYNYVREEADQLHEDFSITDSPNDILKKVFYSSIAALQDTLSILQMDEFESAVNAIIKANKILLLGVGGSGYIAGDASHKFLKVGIDANYYNDANLQAMSASLLTEKDLVIGISHSGKTKSVINALTLAKNAGATTICITNYIMSPITDVSDIKLVSSARNSPLSGENASARIVHLNILDALYTATVLNHYDSSMKNLEKTHNAVNNTKIGK